MKTVLTGVPSMWDNSKATKIHENQNVSSLPKHIKISTTSNQVATQLKKECTSLKQQLVG